MKFKLILLALLVTSTSFIAQTLQSPEEFLGYKIGSRFTRHHNVVNYFKHVSKTTNSAVLEQYGSTNEHRPLYVTYVSSEENIKNLEQIRQNNLSQTGLTTGNKTNAKAIVWLSYNVHGNEASSTEAAMLTLYNLVTKQQNWLKNTVVILDPCLNPDGRDRYVNWYNQVKSTPFNTNQDAKEHQELWPGGRPNHYLFDLNRDWAWATQVETQQRIKIYNKWLPHIHVDFHEQYINNPYYFAPAAAPFHDIISDWQKEFQVQIGKNHAKYFDKEGWLYFTKESFDLLYPSYGDTYPTFMGAIGMTYEQAGHGMAGLGINTDEGEVLTLTDRAQHHLTTGLSTVEIASKNAEKLNTEFVKFFNKHNPTYKSYVIKTTNTDNVNTFKKLLNKHEITYEYATANAAKGYHFKTQKQGRFNLNATDLVVHTDQPKGKMVSVLLEPKTKLTDSLTYDITAWSLPYAYGFNTIASKTKVASTANATPTPQKKEVFKNAYAYITKWNSIADAKFLSALLKANITPRFTEKTFKINGNTFNKGSLLILKNDNKSINLYNNLTPIATTHNRQLTAVKTGFVDSGKDFGSAAVKPINKQRIAIVSGKNTSSLSYGEFWHFFETQLGYPITSITADNLSNILSKNYDVIILPNGNYNNLLNNQLLTDIKRWVSNGGTLLTVGNALQPFAKSKDFALNYNTPEVYAKDTENTVPYADRERQNVAHLISGSIFKSTVDATHPLAFGYNNTYFTLKTGGRHYALLNKGYNVAYFNTNAAPVSGYAGSIAKQYVANSLLFGEETIGSGSIVYMVDNPLFRSFWENGKLFVANAVFLLNSNKLK